MVARASEPAKRPRSWTLHTLPADEALTPEVPQSGPAAVLEASTDLCGRLLGARYDVLELLSHGERGAVYLAHDRNYGRPVALRLAAPRSAVLGGEDVRALARRRMGVRHPHLAAVQGEGLTEGGLHYVAMEHVEGRNLHHMLGDPRLRWPALHAIGVQVAEALVALHGAWVVHGDVHPGNLVWTADPERPVCIKLVDVDVAEREVASPYVPAGFHGERDSTCDVYGLVASLYELACGTAPEPTLAALAAQTDLPEWFTQLLRSGLRAGIPSARGLLASLRQAGGIGATTTSEPSGPRFMTHAAHAVDAAPAPTSGAGAMREMDAPGFLAHAPSGPLPHAPTGPLFAGAPVPVVHSPSAGVPVPVVHSPSAGVPVPVVHSPSAGVPVPVVHSPSAAVPVPVVHSPSAAAAAATLTEDELWFAAVAEFDPLQRLESMAAEAATSEPEIAAAVGEAVAPAEPVRLTDLDPPPFAAIAEETPALTIEPPPPFAASTGEEAPAMVTMGAAFFDPRPSPVLGVPVVQLPAAIEDHVEVTLPEPGSSTASAREETIAVDLDASGELVRPAREASLGAVPRSYEATAEIVVKPRARTRAVAAGALLLAGALIVWRFAASEAAAPAPTAPAVTEPTPASVKPASAKAAAITPASIVPAAPVATPEPPVAPPEAAPAPEAAPGAAPPLADEAEAEVDETAPLEQLSAGEFRQILLRANRGPSTVKCYMQHTAGVEQKVEVVVRVSGRGRVQKLRIDDGPLGDCLRQVVERLQFPRARRSAQHQFVFKSPIEG